MGGYVVCPYCDPNFKPYPSIDEACRGYDVPMGNPSPGQGKTDPGNLCKLKDIKCEISFLFCKTWLNGPDKHCKQSGVSANHKS